MFAVKGWSVDASALKPQTEILERNNNADRSASKSSQRKREARDTGNNPDRQSDVGSLWEQHVEGKKPSRNREQTKPDNLSVQSKKRKLQQELSPESLKSKTSNVEVFGEPAISGDAGSKSSDRSKKSKKSRDQLYNGVGDNVVSTSQAKVAVVAPATKLTPMQSAMRQKLVSARFRHLNETLYTAPSATSLALFDQNPDMFDDYHTGFRQQVSVWPENPLDNFIESIRRRAEIRRPHRTENKKQHGRVSDSAANDALPRTHGTAIIADLGCGDARLAKTLKESGASSRLKLQIHSFDLHSPSPLVTKADISELPLEDGSVDIAIFCLALMGTNWISFIEEAYRILHWKGELWIAEIKSRFGRVGRAGKPVDHSVGSKRKLAAAIKAREKKEREAEDTNEQEALQTEVDGVLTNTAETDVSAFVDVLRRRGFILKAGERSIDLGNKMFVKMEFLKASQASKGKGVAEAKARDTTQLPTKTKLKFLDATKEDEPTTDDEGKVLKPCLYKNR